MRPGKAVLAPYRWPMGGHYLGGHYDRLGISPENKRCILIHLTEFIYMSDQIVQVTDENFDAEVLNSDIPVLIDYWAEWCGPCKMIGPILEELVGEYQGKVKIAKLNIDDNPNTPPKFGIRSIPTLMIFKNGNVEGTKVGGVSKNELAKFIDTSIA